MKANKTFKIGEYAKGGIITVEIKDKKIDVIGKEWDYSTGSRRSSDQSNAKEFTRQTFTADHEDVQRDLQMFINDLTTSYYTDEIIKWIESKVKLQTNLHW
jgi:hypothetical protein